MIKGFWELLEKPIIALAPMDGVTDAAFRYIIDKYGKPSILFTEFTSAEGIVAGAWQLLYAFVHHRTNTPTVAQIFGADPQAFYKVAFIIGEMGFDGIDINMGCPDRNVAKKGGGAGLIRTPEIAKQIVAETKRGTEDWAGGVSIATIGLNESVTNFITGYKHKNTIQPVYQPLPVSVKTRIGYDEIVTENWISTLLETEPVAVSIHGRTLKQLYTGEANWEEIAKAARLIKRTNTMVLGNGDIHSLADARKKINKYGVDGVLIGRAAMGNPAVFQGTSLHPHERFAIAYEQCKAFETLTPELHFLSLRKHLAWYCKGFDGASEMRVRLLQTQNAQEVKDALQPMIQMQAQI